MAGTIPVSQASPLYTSMLRTKFDEMQSFKVNNFFRSFFKKKIYQERYPIIEVRRGTQQVAVDVRRGHQGVRTQIAKFTQKAFDPFYYNLKFDATQMDCYWRAFGSTSFNLNAGAELVNGVATHNKANQDMIERAIEIHCASILENGTCTSLNDGSIVDYKRQAGSMVTKGAGTTWDVAGVDPHVDLKSSIDFISQNGGTNVYYVNVIFGSEAWAAYRANSFTEKRWNQVNNKRDMLNPAQLEANGAVYQGEIDCDTYKARCWTYNATYDNSSLVKTPYMNPKKIYIVAENPDFELMYGAIPQVVMPGSDTLGLVAGEFILSDFKNLEEKYHNFHVESSPLPVPVVPDQMATLQPVL